MTDAAWAVWEPPIEEVRPGGKTPPKELRRTISAIFWRHQTGGTHPVENLWARLEE